MADDLTKDLSEILKKAASVSDKAASMSADISDDKAGLDNFDEEFLAHKNIFSPSDPDIKELMDYWGGVLRTEVYPAFMRDHRGKTNIDPDQLELVIYDDDSGAVRITNTNIIGVSVKSLLNAMSSGKDGVIAMLAHETLHRALDWASNNKLQEGMAEYREAATTHRAGYAVEPAMAALQNSRPNTDLNKRIGDYKDEHLSKHFNKRLVQIAISRLRAEVGELSTETTPLPERVRQITQSVERKLWDGDIKPSTKLDLITNRIKKLKLKTDDEAVLLIRDIATVLRKESDISSAEIRDIKRFLSGAKLNPENPVQYDAMVDLLNALTEPKAARRLEVKEEDITNWYASAFDTRFFGGALPRETNLAQLITAYNSFTQARSYEEALEAAKHINEIEKVASYRGGIYEHERRELISAYARQGLRIEPFPNGISDNEWEMLYEGNPEKPYSRELKAPVSLPWAKHVEWSQREIQEAGTHSIAHIGYRFSQSDSAFEKNNDFYSGTHSSVPETVDIPAAYDRRPSVDWDKCERDENGNITGLGVALPEKYQNYIFKKDTTAEEAESKERQILNERLDYELRLVAETDWSELRSNPSAFLRQYRNVLVPHVGLHDFSHPFAQRFADEILSITSEEKPNSQLEGFLQLFFNENSETGEDIDYRDTFSGLVEETNEPGYRISYENTARLRASASDPTLLNMSLGVSSNHPFYQLDELARKIGFDGLRNSLEQRQKSFEPMDVKRALSFDDISIPSFLETPDAYLSQPISAIVEQIDAKTTGTDGRSALYKNLLVSAKLEEGVVWNGIQDIRKSVEPLSDAYTFLTDGNIERNEVALRASVESYARQHLIGSAPPAEAFEIRSENEEQRRFDDVHRQITLLKYFDYHSAFLGLSDTREQVIASIIDGVSQTDFALRAQQYLVEYLLLGEYQRKHDQYGWAREESTNVKNDKQLERIANIYAATLVSQLARKHGRDGLDYGDTEYQGSVEKMVESVYKRFKYQPNALYLILNSFANQAELQKTLALKVEDQVQRAATSGLEGIMAFGAGGEATVDYINKNERIKSAFLHFLKSEKSHQNASDVFDAAQGDKHRITEFIKNMGDLNEQDEDTLLAAASSAKLRSVAIDILLTTHDGFWSQPLPLRGVAIDLLLFPADEELHEWTFDRKKKNILDKIFPDIKIADAGSSKDADRVKKMSRLFVEAFLNNSERDDQRLLLSSLYVAQQPGASSELSLGKTLREVLAFLKPAGDKMAQAISNHPATPDYIAKDLEETKVEAGNAPRSDLIRDLERSLGETLEEAGVERVGQKLGEGSMATTMAVMWEGGRSTASSVLKTDIRTRGAYRFQQMRATVEEVLTHWGTKELAPILTMIEQAERSFYTEVDMDLAEQQAELASDLYDGQQIKIDGKTVHFSAAKWGGHGKDIKHADVVEGMHFLDLPNDTSKAVTDRATVAKAILSLELQIILSGGRFDNDRHDGQQKIIFDGNDIYVQNFDFGGIIIDEPTPAQKDAFAKTLVSAVRQTMNGGSFIEAFSQQIAKYKGNTDNQEYLAAVNRGMLALGNYSKFVSQEDLTAIFLKTIQNRDGKLDIPKRMEKVAPSTAYAIKLLGSAASHPILIRAKERVEAVRESVSKVSNKFSTMLASVREAANGVGRFVTQNYAKLNIGEKPEPSKDDLFRYSSPALTRPEELTGLPLPTPEARNHPLHGLDIDGLEVSSEQMSLLRSDTLRSIVNSLTKIEAGEINSNDMLARMLLINGSPAWRQKGISSQLEDAAKEIGEPDVSLGISRDVYHHIAARALTEAAGGSEVGLSNAREAMEKGFSLVSGSLGNKSMAELSVMLSVGGGFRKVSTSGMSTSKRPADTTIYDVIENGKPYALQMKPDHHNFFACRIFDPNKIHLAEVALFNEVQTSDILDDDGEFRQNAQRHDIVQTARYIVEDAFNTDDHTEVPHDVERTPELMESLAKLLVRSAMGHVDFYRKACNRVHDQLTVKKISDVQSSGTIPRELLIRDFGYQAAWDDEEAIAKTTHEFYDRDLMGGNSYANGLASYHLTKTILDPNHDASDFTRRQFHIFFNEINPVRQTQGANDNLEDGIEFSDWSSLGKH